MWFSQAPDEQFIQELLIHIAIDGEGFAPGDMQREKPLLWSAGIIKSLEEGSYEPLAFWRTVGWFASRQGRWLSEREDVEALPRPIRDALVETAVAMNQLTTTTRVRAGGQEQAQLVLAVWDVWGPNHALKNIRGARFGKLLLKGLEQRPFSTLEAIRTKSLSRLFVAVAYSAGDKERI